MKKARLVVRSKIIKTNGGVHNDEGLRALDGIYYSPYEEFNDNISDAEIMEELSEKYAEEYKHIRHDGMQIEFK